MEIGELRMKVFDEENRKLLLELICTEQIRMIMKNPSKYESEKYVRLEEIKAQINEM